MVATICWIGVAAGVFRYAVKLPRAERSVLLGNLAPGAYRFLFRAVTPDGVVSPAPASLAFKLLPPYWQRWWFVLLVATAAVWALCRIYTRVAR